MKIDILDRMGYLVAQIGEKRIANDNLVAPNDLCNQGAAVMRCYSHRRDLVRVPVVGPSVEYSNRGKDRR